jgi:CO/xanthine dehydrogenase Mo-binding subunit
LELRAVGKPVRVQWMRHDMTEWGPKAPAIVGHARAAVRDGAIAALDLTVRALDGGEISSHPDSAGNFLGGQLAGHANTKPRVEYAVYGKNSPACAIPALRASAELIAPLAPLVSPLRTTHLRDPEGPGTTFIVESFVDELAARAGAGPIAFRIAHLRDARQIAALRALAQAAGWQLVERVLFVPAHPGAMRHLAVLSAAADARDRERPARREPRLVRARSAGSCSRTLRSR